MPAKPIGQSMIAANLINEYQLKELLNYQRNLDVRTPLGKLTVELGLVKEDEFAAFLASYFNVPYMDLNDYLTVQPEVLDLVPQSIAKRLNILPVLKHDDTLTVAMSDPLDLAAVENLETVTHCRIKRVVSSPAQIRQSIKFYYSGPAPFLMRQLIERAYKSDVKNIHIQPEKNRVEILFRVKNRLEKIASYPKSALMPLSDYVKKASNLGMKMNEAPQEGYFNFNSDNINIEIGVSILPTVSGERIVLEVPRKII